MKQATDQRLQMIMRAEFFAPYQLVWPGQEVFHEMPPQAHPYAAWNGPPMALAQHPPFEMRQAADFTTWQWPMQDDVLHRDGHFVAPENAPEVKMEAPYNMDMIPPPCYIQPARSEFDWSAASSSQSSPLVDTFAASGTCQGSPLVDTFAASGTCQNSPLSDTFATSGTCQNSPLSDTFPEADVNGHSHGFNYDQLPQDPHMLGSHMFDPHMLDAMFENVALQDHDMPPVSADYYQGPEDMMQTAETFDANLHMQCGGDFHVV